MAQGKTKGSVSLYNIKVQALRELLEELPAESFAVIGAKWYDGLFKATCDLVLVAPSDIGAARPIEVERATSIIPPPTQPRLSRLEDFND